MTVRELRNILDDIEDPDVEIFISVNEDGSDGIISEIEIDEYDPENTSMDIEEDLIEEGSIIIRPVEYL